ncbi:MAG: CDP-diacylglycerol--glycerol-3-phosphate 3-phosphatidyltransferase [Gemmataceae bacterium]|nr:CDP-diacylglycerol--glycerol-3-phosphate 3-phosphatidyltransferase [Gemmataceae bacterium]MDW8266525.1 CDP-diacylglycerol--glycerol-3-phosphate 3-phosphatidyltransferase [Gemmataceae bacterium]
MSEDKPARSAVADWVPPSSAVRKHLNIPNQLTLARLGLAVFLFVFISLERWIGCILIFAAAALTDWLDGYLARKQQLTSTLGRNLDPLVDKVLIGGAYIFLLPVEGSGLAPWMVTVVIARELIITSLRSFLENRGASFGADWLGKLKMGLQCAALFGIFAALEAAVGGRGSAAALGLVARVLIYGMVVVTALSGLQYLWRASLLLPRSG